MILKYINLFVELFLENNNSIELLSIWRCEQVQEALVKHCRKYKINLKDPTKPKRGKSAFLYYCDYNRSILREKFPDLTIKQIVSKLGSSWQELKSEGKINDYEQMSIVDRNRYKTEMKSYYPTKLKKINFAFKKFECLKYDKIKEKFPDYTPKQIRKLIKEKWRKMTVEKKERYM